MGKTVRVLLYFPELRLLLHGLAGAMKAIFWGIILIGFLLVTYSIIAVQLIHPLATELGELGHYDGCDRCVRSFESVQAAVLTLTQQLVAGDSWGTVTIPLLEHYPYTFPYFLVIFVSVHLAVLSVILAVIVDSALEARKEAERELQLLKEEKFLEARTELEQVCSSMDLDCSGALTLGELEEGYMKNAAFGNVMKVMDVEFTDMSAVFRVLDADKSGDVKYREFVDQLYKMKTKDSNTVLVFVKLYMQELRGKIEEQVASMEMQTEQIFGRLQEHHDQSLDHITSTTCAQAGTRPVPTKPSGKRDASWELRQKASETLLQPCCTLQRDLAAYISVNDRPEGAFPYTELSQPLATAGSPCEATLVPPYTNPIRSFTRAPAPVGSASGALPLVLGAEVETGGRTGAARSSGKDMRTDFV